MAPPLRAAVIGARIGRLHALALRALPQTTLRWVCDSDQAVAARVAAECGARATGDYAEVLADADVDLVSLAVPHHLHFAFARRALEAGKHVAVEKPLCPTLDEIDRLIALRSEGRPRIGVIFQNRFAAAARRFVACVRGGEIGTIRLASLSLKWFREPAYYAAAPWRARQETAGGGVLTTQAIHYLDLMQAAAGMPTVVEARIATLAHDIEVEDTAVVTGTLPGGGLFNAVATVGCYPEEPAYLHVVGARGSACLVECRGRVCFAARAAGDGRAELPLVAALEELGPLAPQDGAFPIQVDDDGHRRFFDAFATSIAAGLPFEMDAQEARKTAVILDAIYRSARVAKPIALG